MLVWAKGRKRENIQEFTQIARGRGHTADRRRHCAVGLSLTVRRPQSNPRSRGSWLIHRAAGRDQLSHEGTDPLSRGPVRDPCFTAQCEQWVADVCCPGSDFVEFVSPEASRRSGPHFSEVGLKTGAGSGALPD